MDEADKKQVEGICWRTVLIAVVLMAIGAGIGHIATVKHCWMTGKCGGYGMKSSWNKCGTMSKCPMNSKCDKMKQTCDKQSWSECKEKTAMCKAGCTCPKCSQKAAMCKPGCTCPMCCQKAAMCKPGCTCPMCLKKAECKSDPNKAGCPMSGEKAAEPTK